MNSPRPGDAFYLDLVETAITGHFVEVDSPRRMVIAWNRRGTTNAAPAPALIEVTFTPTSDGAAAMEIQLSGLSAEDATTYSLLLNRYLDQLAATATGR